MFLLLSFKFYILYSPSCQAWCLALAACGPEATGKRKDQEASV